MHPPSTSICIEARSDPAPDLHEPRTGDERRVSGMSPNTVNHVPELKSSTGCAAVAVGDLRSTRGDHRQLRGAKGVEIRVVIAAAPSLRRGAGM